MNEYNSNLKNIEKPYSEEEKEFPIEVDKSARSVSDESED